MIKLKVRCELKACSSNKEGYCNRKKIHLVPSGKYVICIFQDAPTPKEASA